MLIIKLTTPQAAFVRMVLTNHELNNKDLSKEDLEDLNAARDAITKELQNYMDKKGI